MLTALELVTAIAGIMLLHEEMFKKKFLNYATTIFLLCFVPLFCVYPVIARLVVGGAYSIRPGDDQVIDDPSVYLIYQFFCLGVLIMTFATRSKASLDRPWPNWRVKYEANPMELAALVGLVGLGVYLYVYSTGFSVRELILASRFEWFNNLNYSPVAYVVSSYLIALSPVAMLLAAQNRKYRWVIIALVLILILNGLLSKDRKWLVYIISASFAYIYVRNGFSITLNRRAIIAASLAVAALAFWQVGRGVVFDYLVTGTGDLIYDSQQMAIRLLTKGDLPYYYNASITAIHMNITYDFLIPFGIVRRQVLFFLPASFSFGLKIEDISALFSDAIGAEDSLRRGNMPPGLFGLFVISFGWIGGIFTCSLIPLALRAIDRFIHRNRGLGSIVVTAHLLSSVTLLLRGDDSSATYFIISSLAILYIIRPSAMLQPRMVDSQSPQGHV